MATLSQIIKKREKDWNAPHMLDGAKAPRGSKLPFSSPLVNYCTYGGIPRDKITTFYGTYSGGKSTSAIDICKNSYKIFLKEFEDKVAEYREEVANGNKKFKGPLEDLLEQGPKKILYLDLEHSFDGEWAKTLGVNPDEIIIMQPPDVAAEDLLDTIQEIIETCEVGMLVLDSIPSLVSKQELDKKYSEKTVAATAGPLTRFMRKIPPILTRCKCTLLLINQIRPDMNNPYADNLPGGEAVKFYSSLMIKFQITDPVDILGQKLNKSAEDPAGYIIQARLTKQKSAPNNRKVGTYYLISDQGIREDFDFANMAINQYGIIQKSGGWYSMCNPLTGEILEDENGKLIKVNGLAKVYSYLKDNPKYYERLKEYILNDINGIEQPEYYDDDDEYEEEVEEVEETEEAEEDEVEENTVEENSDSQESEEDVVTDSDKSSESDEVTDTSNESKLSPESLLKNFTPVQS